MAKMVRAFLYTLCGLYLAEMKLQTIPACQSFATNTQLSP